MPSAARQRLPVALCHQGHGKYSNGGLGPVYHFQEIQASPGHCDVSEDDKQQKHQGSKKQFHKSQRKQVYATAQRSSPKSIPRRGSADLLNKIEFEERTDGDRKETFELSSSAKSNSCPSLNPFGYDAFAMDSSVAPHPNEVPFPPLEWLHLSKESVSAVVSNITLKAILCCHAPT